jgi:hypothetical protein
VERSGPGHEAAVPVGEPEVRLEETAPADAVVAPAPAPAEPPAPTPEETPVARRRLAPRPKLEAWTPRHLPAPRLGRPEDPRLAAAIAARERWHGRSGRPALKSATQAVAFARERRLVQLVEPTALPNLLDPIVGKACLPEERVEGPTAHVFRGWRKEFEAAHDLLELRLAFERPTLAQAELWPSIVAVAAPREEAARDGSLPLPREADEVLEILDRKGAVPVERLRSLVGLEANGMDHLRGLLEAQFLVLARPEVDEDEGPIVVLEPVGRWATRAVGLRRPELHQAFTMLFAAAVRSAAVLWPDEIAALFPWSPEERDTAVSACLQAGAVVTYDEGGSVAYVASPVPR